MRKEEGWAIRFRQPLLPVGPKTSLMYVKVVGWTPAKSGLAADYKLHYWDSKYKWWTTNVTMAYLYATQDRAERTAFVLAARDPSLVGELEVEYVQLAHRMPGATIQGLKLKE